MTVWRRYRYNHVRLVRERWIVGWVTFRPLVWLCWRLGVPALWRVPLVVAWPVIWRADFG